MRYEAIVIGVSAGGLQALKTLLPALSSTSLPPIAIVQHIEEHSGSFMVEYLDQLCSFSVKEAEDKEPMLAGHAYLAPAGYHLLVEPDRTFSLSVDERVNYCRPSVDILFESAAEAFGNSLIGVILTGGNKDGAKGLQTVAARGGVTIVQHPETAEAQPMPRAAREAVPEAACLPLEQIAPFLMQLCTSPSKKKRIP
ncbi:MAG TPA: chemotaxis protein CheB [Rickettsiales bacterium]|nr:chemotaxis protein CheB [Rickettsiales bacterium]